MFIKYWQTIVQKNPQLEDSENKLRISVGEFEKVIRRAYNFGYDTGNKEGWDKGYKEAFELNNRGSHFGDLFGEIFRNK